MQFLQVIFVLISLNLCFCASAQDTWDRRSYTETIFTGDHSYNITMLGTMDGPSMREPIGYGYWKQTWEPMRTVRLENVGDTVVVNPWIFTNDRGHWRTCRELVENIVAPYSNDNDRAIALWWAETRHRYHSYTDDAENNDPIKVWNVYGYNMCGNDAHVMADLWRTAGFGTYCPSIQGHVISEVFLGGRRCMMDGDENIIVLLRDNEAIASEAEIRSDHELIKRTHCYGILSQDSRQTDEFSASLYAHEQQPPLDYQTSSNIGHDMNFSLRPGEALVWGWKNRGKYHGSDPTLGEGTKPLANGMWQFQPRLTAERIAADSESFEGIVPGYGQVLGPGSIIYRVCAPYLLVGGEVQVSGTAIGLALSWDGKEWNNLTLSQVDGPPLCSVLDKHFPPTGLARYEYLLKVNLGKGGRLTDLQISNDLQMAPLCMPYLELGDNLIQYVDETAGPRKVELTHEWFERSDNHPPTAPVAPIFPASGTTLDRTQFTFEWHPVTDPDGDEIADYQFQLSRYQDMRWPLSPNFFKLISRTANTSSASYAMPYVGLLNPDTTYYWQVRARDVKGLWGSWSDVWYFQPGGPGVPRNLTNHFNKTARSMTISWCDALAGSKPIAWKIYGSDEQGFSVSDTEYQVWMGNQHDQQHDWQPFPANLMATTNQHSIQVAGPMMTLPNSNRAFYRVVAVDANGIESGPSDFIAMPRPLIYSAPPVQATIGQPFKMTIRAISSKGDLRCRTLDDPQMVYNSAFWDIEYPIYSLEDAPEWLTINAENGNLTGTPPISGEFPMTVRATIKDVGEDALNFTITVRP